MEVTRRKQLGAFYTPPEVARYLASWAIRSRMDRVLEPSCGEAEFLIAAADRLKNAGGCLFNVPLSLTGVEINSTAAESALKRLAAAGVDADIHSGNFFEFPVERKFDAVVGNPPYIRYQQFTGELRLSAIRSSLAAGVPLSGLASSWAAFVIHCTRMLAPTGRLGLVLPAELLTVNYAEPIREFLLRRFSSIKLVTFQQRVFSNAQEEVVLLLAEGNGRTSHFKVYPANSISCLSDLKQTEWRKFDAHGAKKWSSILVAPDQNNNYNEAIKRSGFCPLSDWGTTYLGAVTGNNKFFALRADEVDALRLRPGDLRRISPPGSRHLRSHAFTTKAWQELAHSGARCYLFYPRARLTKSSQRYIDHGEASGVHTAYKCSVREPWWIVPMVDTAQLFLTYMDAERPRLVHNTARVDHLNSLYGIRLHRRLARYAKCLPIASLNSLTTLGAELIGRSYGGGMLKMEPREADQLPMPPMELVRARLDRLMSIEPQVSTLAAQGKLMDACAIVDKILFLNESPLGKTDLDLIRSTRSFLRERRRARAGRNVKG